LCASAKGIDGLATRMAIDGLGVRVVEASTGSPPSVRPSRGAFRGSAGPVAGPVAGSVAGPVAGPVPTDRVHRAGAGNWGV
jgi:hypothetical protein